GLPAPITIVLVSGSKVAVCHGAPPPWLQASTRLPSLSRGHDGALGSPLVVLSLPSRRPMWPSTSGRAQTSAPVSGSRAKSQPTTPNSSPEEPCTSSTRPDF